jgi:hypothetical protein
MPTQAAKHQAARQKAMATIIFQTIQDSYPLQDILTAATTVNQKAFFISKLLIAVPNAFMYSDHRKSPPQLFDILTIWFGKFKFASSKFPAVATALNDRKHHFLDNRNNKVDFIHRIGLNWSPDTRDLFLSGLKPVYLPKLRAPYPPINHWMCESDAIYDKWSDYLKHDPRAQPDKRRPRQPIFRCDPSRLSLDIETDQSTIVYDADSKELILLVLRNFSSDPDLLSHIEGVIKQAVEMRKSIRVSHFNKYLPHLFTSASLRILARLSKLVIRLGPAISQLSIGCETFFQRGPQRTQLKYSIAILHIYFPYFGCSFARSFHR